MNIKAKHFFFVGIGGIGMSGLAKILVKRGFNVSGSDIDDSNFQDLNKLGIKNFKGHKAENLTDADVVIATAAVKEDNPEIVEARKRNIPVYRRSELLGDLMSEKKGIAVAGTHGKTTTSAMLSLVLEKAGLDPTILVGGEVKALSGNSKDGKGEYIVAEACEYERAFLDLSSYGAIITNIEEDHLDIYKDIDDILETFKLFLGNIDPEGFLAVNTDDQNLKKISSFYKGEIITYGLSDEKATWKAKDINVKENITFFKVYKNSQQFAEFSLKVPGIHNVMNALAVIAVSSRLGIKIGKMIESISEFTGADRRFEIKGEKEGILVIDDYAHHPTEVRSTLSGLRTIYQDKRRKIWCVFQPHQYSRTRLLLNEFAEAFSDADEVIIPEIYKVRDTEEDVASVNGQILADEINKKSKEKKAIFIADFESIADYLSKKTVSGDIIITMGAGPVYKVGEEFLEKN